MKLATRLLAWSGGLLHGQPLPNTHPHLLSHPSTIMPGISRSELKHRRESLVRLMGPGSLAVIPGYRMQYSSQNIFYRFKQNNNVLYLTGLNEPEICVIIGGDDDGRLMLFRNEPDEHQLLWDGPSTDEATLKDSFGFDEVP